jgi:hypothetical protein
MDVQKTMEFLLEQQARADARTEAHYARMEAHHAKMEAEFEVIQANLREASRLNAEAAERADRADERADRADERADRADERANRTDVRLSREEARLSRAIRLSIKESRDERSRRRKGLDEIDEKITQLAASHLMTEEVLRDFIASLKGKSGNGHNS